MYKEKRRNEVVEAITCDLHGRTFVSVAVFKDDHLVDIITKEPEDDDGGFSVMLDAMVTHEMGPVELRTDSEELFKRTVAVAGILGRLVSRGELSELYRQFRPDSEMYPVLCDLYAPDDGSKPEPEQVGWMARIMKWIRGRLQAVNNRIKNKGDNDNA